MTTTQPAQTNVPPSAVLGVPESVSVIFTPSTPLEKSAYPGFEPGTRILEKGSVHRPGGRPLAVDVLEERDVPLSLRDGTTIYVDVFRPVGTEPVPAILAWSNYGKRGGMLQLDVFHNRMDVPEGGEDGLNKFESPNPGYWVSHGYAVVNADPRGVHNSEGNIHAVGQQLAHDEYDAIEWIAQQPWSTGKVALSGNSELAMTQWFVAALRPPHLAAIAPWEGASDFYRDVGLPGGIPDTEFFRLILGSYNGHGWTENAPAMAETHPLRDEYWQSKYPDLEAIEIPAYVVTSWTNILHTRGSVEGWRKISSEDKWLRVHNTHEWKDYYDLAHVEDLRRFFDHFLKGVDNGWEATPRVRLSILDPGHQDVLDRAESTFPLARQRFATLHLDLEHGALTAQPQTHASSRAYEPDADGVVFRHTFDRDTEITGYGKVKLWVAAEDHDDLDVFVFLSKLDAWGVEKSPQVVTDRHHVGPNGRLRVSLRALDPELSTPSEPWHTYLTEQKLLPGEVVPIEISLWPYAIRFHAGETLQLRINGVDLLKRPEFPTLPPTRTLNHGQHVLYAGGEYDSHLLLPIVDEN